MSWEDALKARDDLVQFGSEALGLFGLALRFGADDLVSIAADSILDSINDKKIDILFVDKTLKSAFIMQCYKAEAKFNKSAPLNKASDLNTAITYAISTRQDQIPTKLKPQIIGLRQTISADEIETIYIWYVHNRTESDGVKRELNQVELTAQAHLKTNFPNSNCKIIAQEIGRNTFHSWYEKSNSAITVDDEIKLQAAGHFEIFGPNWSCIATSITGLELFSLYKKHSRELFSLNVRDYLGIVKKDANVNNGIRVSAMSEPDNFWAYNNGITAIVNNYKISDEALILSGISIVNGAQTTGAIGNLEETPDYSIRVPARFFKTSDQNMIGSIIRFNNSQNAIEASDFRSTDSIQKKLRAEFNQINNADYEGGRRGSISDAIKRRPFLIPSYTAGQAMTAFHGDPVLAYNEKSRIWSDNNAYNRIFNDTTTARHIIFCFSLLRAIEETKNNLTKKSREFPESMSDLEKERVSFFRNKGSQFLLMHIVSQCMELFLKMPIPNKFKITFVSAEMAICVQHWAEILESVLSFSNKMSDYLSDGLKSNEKMNQAAIDMRQTLSAIKSYNKDTYSKFSSYVSILN